MKEFQDADDNVVTLMKIFALVSIHLHFATFIIGNPGLKQFLMCPF